MCDKCENCHVLIKLEEERMQWYKDLSIKNIQLHKQIIEQNDIITILKMKLLDKKTHLLSEYASSRTSTDKDLEGNKNFQQEFNKLAEIINSEKELFQKELEANEKHYRDNISYLNGQIEYFREALFDEYDKSNKLKVYFIEKLTGLAAISHDIVLNTLKEESIRLNNELKSRYKKTIEKSRNEIERQSDLVLKLRKHNRELYSLLQKTNKSHEDKITSLEKKLQDLKTTIKNLKLKNDKLHTQIKLEVEGCQNDIFDARKTIRKLIKQQK